MPLAIILFFRLIEELAQQAKTYKRDRKLNNQEYARLRTDGSLTRVRAGDIRVGDVIKLSDDRVPADLIVLAAK